MGRVLPDHGEWWTTAWSVAKVSDGQEAIVRLRADTQVFATSCVKEFRLADDSNELVVSYSIENRETSDFNFLFKQHLAIALTPQCELAMPGGRVTPVDSAFGTVLPDDGPFDWPMADSSRGRVDLRRVLPRSSHAREFVYVSDLPAGWCGIHDVEHRASLRMRFDRQQLPFVWLFLAYGGWRGCYTVVLEPCTNMPKDLGEAVRRGQSAWLSAGGRFETRVAVALSGMDGD